jgi:hypothetical protein
MGDGLGPSGGVLVPFRPVRLVYDPETDGRGGDMAGIEGDFAPKMEFKVEDDLLRGMSTEAAASTVAPSCECESLLLERDCLSFAGFVFSPLELLALDLRRNSLRKEGIVMVQRRESDLLACSKHKQTQRTKVRDSLLCLNMRNTTEAC